MNLASLYRRLSEYQNYKYEVEGLIASLKNTVNPLSHAKDVLNNIYKYDDYVADNGKLANINVRLNRVLNNLENNILPSINRKIRSISDAIDDAERALAAMEEENK